MNKMKCDALFLKKMNEYIFCVNWNMMERSELIKCKSTKGYLLTTDVTPENITFTDLKNTINVYHETLISKEWNEKNVRFYGAVNCISEKGKDKIIEHANN